jgi:hypothetical protein
MQGDTKMTVGFNRREPVDPSKIYAKPKVVKEFQKSNRMDYFNKLKWFDDRIALEFAKNFQHS